ncbi:L-type lectin-domain containing receptor kinase VII.1 [Abeliophyllum distichum]|uniref:non-specific serine/threonine protein kinase n=1 Tax=Abeliophyllum distichum TaxID=126358 RepID=A0ABD1PRD8_9LAMI
MDSKGFSLFIYFSLFQYIASLEFIFNSFNSSSVSLYGNATIESSILTLTTDTNFSIGRALYPQSIPTRPPNSSQLLPFSTSFIFSISPYPNRLPGHGFAFLFAPSTGINGTNSAQHLGLLNFTNDGNSKNHVFAVKFDVFQNQEFNDLNDNHVGINVNSLTSGEMHEAGYWVGNDEDYDNEYDVGLEFRQLQLNNGENYQVWIDYMDSRVNVTMAPVGMDRPIRPLIDYPVNISDVLLDQMYVGFCAATGALVESHRILSWSLSNSNFSIGDALVTEDLPSFVASKASFFRSKGFIAGITVGSVFFILSAVAIYTFLVRRRRKNGKLKELEKWELEYWPHRMDYQEIYSATKGSAEENVIGYGGNGKVYKGVLAGGIEVAVKRISLESERGMGEFLAEISSLGRLKHRNLVSLRGWCNTEKRSLLLIYDYMENGSLDKWLFDCGRNAVLNWEQRMKVLKDVASGVFYLHEGWESKVLHRDIKASNVLLDKDMNAKLADFGLARMHNHGQLASTTQVVGTLGYMAPELVRTGRPSALTDVFGFGVLVLEVVCGRKPIEEGKHSLVEWVYGLMERGELINALDERLKRNGEIDQLEVENVLRLGLWCANPDPNVRPSMRLVLKKLQAQGAESEEEGITIGMLTDMHSPGRWSYYHHNIGPEQPTLEDIRNGLLSSSVSWSTSDISLKG